jgi:hypothetical protein
LAGITQDPTVYWRMWKDLPGYEGILGDQLGLLGGILLAFFSLVFIVQ